MERAGGDPSGWYVPPWTEQADKQFSESIGTKTAILSVTAPGASIERDPSKAATLARECNEYCAKLRDRDPGGYGFFASLPSLLDTEASLKEITYSLDELKADGVILFTRYGDGLQYLGHEDFKPIWAELSQRKVVVLIHPTSPVDTRLIHPSLPQPMYDYPHETGRAAMSLIVSNTLRDYPGCKVILSHAGGTLPYLIFRAAGMLPFTPMNIGRSTQEIVEEASNFYFDTAISSNPATLKALFEIAKPGHVLFGSDFPNAPAEGIRYFTSNLEKFVEAPGGLQEVYNGSALKLFPRLEPYYRHDRCGGEIFPKI